MKIIKKFTDFIRNPEIDFQVRLFSLITAIGVSGIVVALIGDIIIGESIVEIVVLLITILVTPMISVLAIKLNRLAEGTLIIAVLIIFLILPVVFFFGGGMYGGAIIWIVFCYLYIGIILKGLRRYIMLGLLTGATFLEFRISLVHPEYMRPHTAEMFYYDTALSVIMLGFVTFTAVSFQNLLFMDENKRAKEEAEKVERMNRAQNRFFSNMSHEIRTPINTILGLNEIILRQNDISEEVANDSRSIEGAGKMLLTIINDILDMSKLESGNMDIVPVSYQIGDMLSEIVNMVWARAESKGLRFKIDVDPSTPTELFGDEVRIKQILINILTNAIKYTREGLVKLYVESDPLGDNEVIMTYAVTDTGIGIKKEAIPHLFDAFRRIDEEKNRNIEGTGLGLAIVKQLVDLMGGDITVNSVYMQGSTFVVKLRQAIVNPQAVGNIIIGTGTAAKDRSYYKHSFEAPEATILIVDDDELNLRVESKLISDTGINVDTALSGEEALRLTLLKQYDVILMDHLMPEMNGIECLRLIREQAGGLNRSTPVIALTANTGSQNQELYRISGFEGYLCKPVTGDQLEAMLLCHLPADKVLRTDNTLQDDMTVETELFVRKSSVVITTSSMCDIPAYVIRNLNIGVIPFKVCTDKGVFLDEQEIEAEEVIKYMMARDKVARTQSPDIIDFEQFFSGQLNRARHIIHITAAGNTLREYTRAVQAARAFGNVTIVDSGRLSGSMGMMVLAAYRLAQLNYEVGVIVEELEALKKRLPCTYIVGKTEFMTMAGHIGQTLNTVAKSFMLHPMIRLKDGKMEAGRLMFGSLKNAWKKYIDNVLKGHEHDIDTDLVIVAYVGISSEDLAWIEGQIRKRMDIKRLLFEQASATTAVNCGPGTFGIMYMSKGGRSYNLSSLIPEERADSDKDKDEDPAPGHDGIEVETYKAEVKGIKHEWYERLKGIDGREGIKNCGGEDAYRPVLEIFCQSIDEKAGELNDFYESGDFENYGIKVHALKSSARIIGAVDLGEEALKLEMAAKEGDEGYIRLNHEAFMNRYLGLKEVLEGVFRAQEDKQADRDVSKPAADPVIIEGMFEAVREAASEMDITGIEEAVAEVEDYRLPENVEAAIGKIRSLSESFDYDGIMTVVEEAEA